MRRTVVILAVVWATACASSRSRRDAFTLIHATGQSLGFGPLSLGMSHVAAERALKRPVTIYPTGYSDACGQGFSELNVAGYRLSVQWSDEAPQEIESIFVSVVREELTRDHIAELDRTMAPHATVCDTSTSPDLVACYRHHHGLLLWAEASVEQAGIRLILEDCTD